MSSQHGVQQPARWRVVLAWAVVAVLGLVAVALLVPRLLGEEPVAAVPTPTPSVITPSPTPVATATVEPSPTPTPTPTTEETRTETVLFEGSPARGPWQQLGTVAEITHPGAPQSASYSWRTFWSDPEEENQPDELWDQLVIEVTDQLVQLGEPVDRPAFGGAEGSEPFNSFGGIQDIYPEDRVFTAEWNGVYTDGTETGQAYFWYLIAFDQQILATFRPDPFVEDGTRDFRRNSAENTAGMRRWATSFGYTDCLGC